MCLSIATLCDRRLDERGVVGRGRKKREEDEEDDDARPGRDQESHSQCDLCTSHFFLNIREKGFNNISNKERGCSTC
jgi:hypothetical protein